MANIPLHFPHGLYPLTSLQYTTNVSKDLTTRPYIPFFNTHTPFSIVLFASQLLLIQCLVLKFWCHFSRMNSFIRLCLIKHINLIIDSMHCSVVVRVHRVFSRATQDQYLCQPELLSQCLTMFEVRNTKLHLFASMHLFLCFSRLAAVQLADCIICLIHFQQCRSRCAYIFSSHIECCIFDYTNITCLSQSPHLCIGPQSVF